MINVIIAQVRKERNDEKRKGTKKVITRKKNHVRTPTRTYIEKESVYEKSQFLSCLSLRESFQAWNP